MELKTPLRFQHPATPALSKGRLAVIDMGSSSLRLVVYDDVEAYPYMVLNQKIWVPLAEGKGKGTFNLAPERMDRVVAGLKWFIWVAGQAGAGHVLAMATSAVREAENGPAFVKRIEKELGLAVHVLSGEEEARLAAYGAVVSIPDAQGAVIDLGGGSLELSDTAQKRFVSLPLGVFSLKTLSGNSPHKAVDVLKAHLQNVPWLPQLQNGSLVAIGSGMRSIARLHMAACKYPLEVVHDYRLGREEAIIFCRRLMDGDMGRKLHDLSRAYSDVLPYRAAALLAMLESAPIADIRFANFGLREGLLFSQIHDCPVMHDPLLAFAAEHAVRSGRGTSYAEALMRWAAPLMPQLEPRFLKAVCMFAEVGWREHQAYRAAGLFNRVLGGAYVAADHNLRARMALASYHRHDDRLAPGMARRLRQIVSTRQMHECAALGALLRLAALLDPGSEGHLDAFRLVPCTRRGYSLQAPEAFAAMQSEEVQTRLDVCIDMLRRTAK